MKFAIIALVLLVSGCKKHVDNFETRKYEASFFANSDRIVEYMLYFAFIMFAFFFFYLLNQKKAGASRHKVPANDIQ